MNTIFHLNDCKDLQDWLKDKKEIFVSINEILRASEDKKDLRLAFYEGGGHGNIKINSDPIYFLNIIDHDQTP